MSNLFVCFSGNDFSVQHSVAPSAVYCLDIDSFVESCELGHACAMSLSIFNDDLTDYKLDLVTSRLVDLVSFDLFNSRMSLLLDAFKVIEGI